MRRRRFIAAGAIVLMLSVGLSLMAVDRAAHGAPPASNPGTPFQAILDKLDQVLTAVTGEPALEAWDRTFPNSTRFVVLSDFNNNAVLDRETGLVWESGATNSSDWFHAARSCYDKTVGGRKGWRPATVEELTSVLTQTVDGVPAPFHPVFSFMWSSTTVAGETSQAWAVQGTGAASVMDKHACCGFGVWCVRGRLGHDGQ